MSEAAEFGIRVKPSSWTVRFKTQELLEWPSEQVGD